VDLAQYSRLKAITLGYVDVVDAYPEIEAAGMPRSRWNVLDMKWGQRLGQCEEGDRLWLDYKRLLREALGELCRDMKPMSFDEYLESAVLLQLGTDMGMLYERLTVHPRAYWLAAYEWADRLESDPWLSTYFTLRFQQEIGKRTGEAPRQQLELIPGTLVRRRQCPLCNGVKTTPSSSAYIYCDFCGALFDYDSYISYMDPASLDPDEVSEMLDQATVDQLSAAFRAGDREEYARITRWRTEVYTEVCPREFSPRIHDPAYRRQMIDEVLVPWRIATRFDPAYMDAKHAAQAADERAMEALDLPSALESLDKTRRQVDLELSIIEREGILARHPDGIDAAMMRRIAISQFVRGWLSFLPRDVCEALIEAAGVGGEYVEAPRVDLENLVCGACGSPMRMPKGAKRRVCESCGQVLDLETRRVPCTSCGSAISLPTGSTKTTEFSCPFCQAHVTL